MIRRTFFLALLLAHTAQAAIVEQFDTLNLIKCTFSRTHHNRIFVKDDRITTVIIPEGDLHARVESNSGQLFIQAVHPYPPTTTVSIVTELGAIQDIELTFSDKPSETLFLVPRTENEEKGQSTDQAIRQEERISHVIHSVLREHVPDGYACEQVKPIKKRLDKTLHAACSLKLVSKEEEVFIWEIANKSRSNAAVCRCDFHFLKPSWVYIQEEHLGPYGKTFAIVGVNRQ